MYDFLIDFIPRPDGCQQIIAPKYADLAQREEEKRKAMLLGKSTKSKSTS